MSKKRILLLGLVIGFLACGQSSNGNNQDRDQDKEKVEDRAKVLIQTELGDIIIELFNETPLHRDNFLKLAEEGFYDGTLFHRVIRDFMIQGGDPDSKDAQPGVQLGTGGPGYTIAAEFVEGKYHQKGALAAARQGDNINPEKESSGSQFYIVQGRVFSHEELDLLEQRTGRPMSAEQRRIYTTTGGTPHLDGAYTVFGRVVEGLEVLDKIAAAETDRANRPIEDISMQMRILR
ncbi:MAG: peptidylprolyl isomerase [Bacteroidetes bacterium]|nr:MAG: peptidylprolyl isomerase [Bacteroidota bacterium]